MANGMITQLSERAVKNKKEAPLALLFFAWYAASVLCTAISKVLVRDLFPSAYWLSFGQFVVAAFVGNFMVRQMTGSKPYQVPKDHLGQRMRRELWVLSFGFSFGMLALNKGYEYMHVSLVETLRATEPVVSAALASLLLPSEAPSALQCATLLPVVAGACLSSAGSADFTGLGLLWVFASNLCFCWRTIKYKQVRKEFGFDDWNLFYQICRRGSVCQLIYALLGDFSGFQQGLSQLSMAAMTYPPSAWLSAIFLVVLNGIFYYTYLQFSWVILTRVPVVTHAVGNSMRRPVVLICNVLYFRNEISLMNAGGICLAFGGVLLYTKAKK